MKNLNAGDRPEEQQEQEWAKVYPLMQQLHAYWSQSKWTYRTLLFSTLLAAVAIPFAIISGGAAAKLPKAGSAFPSVVFGLWCTACVAMSVAAFLSGPFNFLSRDRAEDHLKQVAVELSAGRWQAAGQSALLATVSEQRELVRMRKTRALVLFSLALFLVCAGIAFWATIFVTE